MARRNLMPHMRRCHTFCRHFADISPTPVRPWADPAQTGARPCPARHLDLFAPLAYLGRIMAEKSDPNYKIIAENRRARFDYFIESDLEVGIVLTGSEVKSLRTGQSNIADSYAAVEGGELWLINSYIAAYKEAGVFGHEERQRRKLLVSKRELARL